ncbi:helix-turn-helix domain-containing protein [Spirosoma linguale]|uniref:Plasmid replication protein RepL domain-containing protein n=1 Tax=Spirosoma linguale (strain ATCC 33905 / DSM 74 / LMG 10896 / Claus 1) TaxID=504472 RepID=D2QTI2_SPILD|nr:hypothetical protein Slin_6154 [Spirosoma linguale DSM 74]
MALSHDTQEEVDEDTGVVYSAYNKNFIQIYTDSMGFIEDIINENPMAARVLLVLIRVMKSGNNIAEFSQKHLAGHFGCSERHIQNAIKVLVGRKAIRIIKAGRNNAYQINTKVAWTTHANVKLNKDLFSEPMEFSDEYMSRPKLRTRIVKQTYVG